jgi:type IV pilus assembly protein PilB
MTDVTAFLRTILAQRDNPVAALVFADWLEETGEPDKIAWSQYIRLRHELEGTAEKTPKHRELRARCRDCGRQVIQRVRLKAAHLVPRADDLFRVLPPGQWTVELNGFEIPRPLIELLPESLARENCLVPLQADKKRLLFAMNKPADLHTLSKLCFIFHLDVVGVHAFEDQIWDAIEHHYAPVKYIAGDWKPFGPIKPLPSDAECIRPSDAVFSRLVNLFFHEAVNLSGTEILFEPSVDIVRVRYRIDHAWLERDEIPRRLLRPIADWMRRRSHRRFSISPSTEFGSLEQLINARRHEIRMMISDRGGDPRVHLLLQALE